MGGEPQRLSEADFDRLRKIIKSAIKEDVPPIVRGELVKIGLAVDDADGTVSAQKDMAFLHRARKAFENAGGFIGKSILLAFVGLAGALVSAGFWQHFSRH